MTRVQGWRLVAATGVLTGFGHGFVAFAVSALLKPIAFDLETGRGAVSTAIGLGRLASGVASPLVGRITDRAGPRGIVVGGMVLTAAGLAVLSQVQSEWALYIAWSLMISTGVAAGFTVALDKLVLQTVRERRGMALAVRFAIAAVVSTILVPVVTILVDQFGWRMASLAWAMAILALLPIPLLMFKPGPRTGDAAPVPGPSVPSSGFKQIMRRADFWIIAFGFMAQASLVTGLSIHLVPLMTDHGLDAPLAGTLFGGMILLSVPVRLLAGHLADRAPAGIMPQLLAGIMLIETLAVAALAIWPSLAAMLVAVTALGIGAGAPTVLVLVLCARLFGESRFATVQGSLMFLQVPGTMLAPIAAGVVHDWTGSYNLAFGGFAVLTGVAMLVTLLLRV